MEQLELANAAESTDAAWWRLWREALQTEIDKHGLKEVAYQLDAKPSDISNGLADRDRHYFRAEWLVWLMSRSDDLAKLAARMRGLETSKPKPLTAEEKVRRYERRLARLGEVGAAIKRAALEEED